MVLPSTHSNEEMLISSNGKRSNATQTQPLTAGDHKIKLLQADMGRKKLYSSPFSGAAFGAIFPAAAFFHPLAQRERQFLLRSLVEFWLDTVG